MKQNQTRAKIVVNSIEFFDNSDKNVVVALAEFSDNTYQSFTGTDKLKLTEQIQKFCLDKNAEFTNSTPEVSLLQAFENFINWATDASDFLTCYEHIVYHLLTSQNTREYLEQAGIEVSLEQVAVHQSYDDLFEPVEVFSIYRVEDLNENLEIFVKVKGTLSSYAGVEYIGCELVKPKKIEITKWVAGV
jgi:hypothetical protein